MRVSLNKNDPGYREDAHRFKAYLNGYEVEYCFTADDDLGVCLCHDVETFRRDRLDYMPVKTLTGFVEIVKCNQS